MKLPEMKLPFSIPRNPVTIVGTISRCWLVTYRTPISAVKDLLPQPLEPVTKGDYAYWNVVISHLRYMRPKFTPQQLGMTYWHVAYRLYAKFTTEKGAEIEGLHFIRSDCNDRVIADLGNRFTDFNFNLATIGVLGNNGSREVRVISQHGANATILFHAREPLSLTAGSPFGSLEDAAEFLKYKPNALSVDEKGNVKVVHVKRNDKAWRARLVQVEHSNFEFFKDKPVELEIAYQVDPIYYEWQSARTYKPLG